MGIDPFFDAAERTDAVLRFRSTHGSVGRVDSRPLNREAVRDVNARLPARPRAQRGPLPFNPVASLSSRSSRCCAPGCAAATAWRPSPCRGHADRNGKGPAPLTDPASAGATWAISPYSRAHSFRSLHALTGHWASPRSRAAGICEDSAMTFVNRPDRRRLPSMPTWRGHRRYRCGPMPPSIATAQAPLTRVDAMGGGR